MLCKKLQKLLLCFDSPALAGDITNNPLVEL